MLSRLLKKLRLGEGGWTLEIGNGGYSGMILKGNTMYLKFTTKEKMYLKYSTSRKVEEFIETAKVVFNEILKTV